MKKNFLLVFTFISITYFSCNSSNKKIDCSNFKEGHYAVSADNTVSHFVIIRTDSIQTETEKETGKRSKWKINWLSDCEYTLLLIEDNYGLLKRNNNIPPPVYTYEIIKATPNYYIFITKLGEAVMPLTDTIFKIR